MTDPMTTLIFEPEQLSDVRVTREMVAATSDVDLLIYWFEALDERVVQIKEFWDAFEGLDIKDDSWEHRTRTALAYNNIGKRWVERRLLALGVTPPYPKDDPRGQTIQNLSGHIIKLKARIAELEAALGVAARPEQTP
jgi:hypothetical protein